MQVTLSSKSHTNTLFHCVAQHCNVLCLHAENGALPAGHPHSVYNVCANTSIFRKRVYGFSGFIPGRQTPLKYTDVSSGDCSNATWSRGMSPSPSKSNASSSTALTAQAVCSSSAVKVCTCRCEFGTFRLGLQGSPHSIVGGIRPNSPRQFHELTWLQIFVSYFRSIAPQKVLE